MVAGAGQAPPFPSGFARYFLTPTLNDTSGTNGSRLYRHMA